MSSKLLIVFSSLTNQSSKVFSKLFKKSKTHRNSVFVLIYTWIISSLILTLAFTGMLLGLYSSQKYLPFVESMDQLLANDEVIVAGNGALRSVHYLDPDLHRKLESKINSKYNFSIEFSNMGEIYLPDELILDIIQRKIVLLLNSDQLSSILRVYGDIYLVSAPGKYFHRYLSLGVNRKIEQARKISSMLVLLFVEFLFIFHFSRLKYFVEAGLYDHVMEVWNLYLAIINKETDNRRYRHEMLEYESIDLKNSFQVIFSALLFGYFISLMIFLNEIYLHGITRLIKRVANFLK